MATIVPRDSRLDLVDSKTISPFHVSISYEPGAGNWCGRFISIQFELAALYGVIQQMQVITEAEFHKIVGGIEGDADVIVKHNPIGSREEILSWMLMSCLVSYLSLTEMETPCFSGRANAETYREAIRFVLKNRKVADFDVEPYLDKLSRA